MTIDELIEVKKRFLEQYRTASWFVGVGLGTDPDTRERLILVVLKEADPAVPTEFEGVRIMSEVVGEIIPH